MKSLIGTQEKENYIYAYTYFCEKLLTLGTICVLGVILDNVLNTLLFLIFFPCAAEADRGIPCRNVSEMLYRDNCDLYRCISEQQGICPIFWLFAVCFGYQYLLYRNDWNGESSKYGYG